MRIDHIVEKFIEVVAFEATFDGVCVKTEQLQEFVPPGGWQLNLEELQKNQWFVLGYMLKVEVFSANEFPTHSSTQTFYAVEGEAIDRPSSEQVLIALQKKGLGLWSPVDLQRDIEAAELGYLCRIPIYQDAEVDPTMSVVVEEMMPLGDGK